MKTQLDQYWEKMMVMNLVMIQEHLVAQLLRLSLSQ